MRTKKRSVTKSKGRKRITAYDGQRPRQTNSRGSKTMQQEAKAKSASKPRPVSKMPRRPEMKVVNLGPALKKRPAKAAMRRVAIVPVASDKPYVGLPKAQTADVIQFPPNSGEIVTNVVSIGAPVERWGRTATRGITTSRSTSTTHE